MANVTQRKWGMFANTTQCKFGVVFHTKTSAEISVPSTSKISIDARRLFLSPNWIGVKMKLKSRLSAKGSATNQGICLVNAL